MSLDKYYINIGKAPDLIDFKERMLYRALEILPGFLVWFTLIAMILSSWFFPFFTAIFIIVFCIYWLFRTSHFSFHMVAAYKKLKNNLSADWQKELEELAQAGKKDWQNLYHLVVFPMYKESLEVMKGSFQALEDSLYPKDKMIAVLAIEERAGQTAREVAEKIKLEYGDKFYKFLITVHPQGIEGEIAGKGSNESWAGRKAKEEIIDPLKIPYENVIVSCFDADTQVYPQYFSCLSYYYLTHSDPTRCSFQPIPFYFNNLWDAPFFSRVVSSCNVFWQMMQQQRPEKITTYSSHSMSFKALAEIGFWQRNVVSEDAGIFWKAFLFYDGNYNIVPLHYPLSMDSCLAKNTWSTVLNQYKQQRRWAWGSEGIPYLLFGFFKNKEIAFGKKFRYSFLMLESFWAWGTNALLIVFLGWLPLILGGSDFNATILSYNLPQITRNLMTLAMVGLSVCVLINMMLLPPLPINQSRWKKIFMAGQWFFFPVSLIIFGSFPAIDAQTRLMLGKYMGFWHTEKARRMVAKKA